MMLIPLLLFFLLFYLAFHNSGFSRNQGSTNNEQSPLDILKKRYAEGSLSQDEFTRMKEELSKKN